jgi:hypothetical protein
MSLLLIVFTTIVWYEFLTSMSPFEMLMVVRVVTVLIGLACMTFFLLSDAVKIVVLEEEEEPVGDAELLKEELDQQVDPVPTQEESKEFADLLATQ